MHDLPDWARYDPVVQQALPAALLPYEDPARPAALQAIGARAYEVRDFDTADRVLALAQQELGLMRRPSPLDRLRGRAPQLPPELWSVERSADVLRALTLLSLGRSHEADVWLDHADSLPVGYGDTAGPELAAARGWSALSQDRPATAETVLSVLVARPDLPDATRAVQSARLAVARLVQGRGDGAVEVVEDAAQQLREAEQWPLLASLAPDLVDAHLAARSLSGARAAVERIEGDTIAVLGRDGLAVSQAGAHLAVVLAAIGEADDAERRMRAALDRTRFAPADVLGPALYRGVQLLVTARWQRHLSVPRLARVLRGTAWWADAVAVEANQVALQGLCEAMLDVVSRDSARSIHVQEAAKLALLEGREDDALSLLAAAERLSAAEGDSPVGVRHDVAAVHVLAGREDEAREIVAHALDLVPEGSFEQAGLLHELAASAGRAGRDDEAVMLYRQAEALHTELEHEPDAEDCRRNVAVLTGGPAPAAFAPLRSGLFEMLWG